MDLNDPRRRLQVLNQTSPSIRLATSPQPTPQIKVASATNTPQIQIAGAPSSPAPRSPISVPSSQPTPSVPDTQFKGFSMNNPKTKTIFGLPVGNLMGSYGKTYTIKADQNVNFNDPNTFLKQFDNTADDVRQAYVADLQKNAATDPVAAKTLSFLQDNGRFKGNFNDFASAANDKLYGGLTRGVLRGADFVLPGHNTFGLEQAANQMEAQPQYTTAGKVGNQFGSVEKGIVDIGTLMLGGGAAEDAAQAAAKGTKVEELLQGLQKGSKAEQLAAKLLTRAPSFAAETGIQSLQQAGTGEKQDWKKNLLIAGGTEAGSQILGPLLGKGIYALRGGDQGAMDRAANKVLSKLSKSGSTDEIRNILDRVVPGTDEATTKAVADFIANTDNKEAISNVLDTMSQASAQGVPIKDWVESPKLAGQQADPNAPVASGDISSTPFNAANPPQSYLPQGMHAPGAPDPVAVLSDKAKGFQSLDDFKKYYSELTGEEKAVADSALNGKTPDEFYNAVKGTKETASAEASKPYTTQSGVKAQVSEDVKPYVAGPISEMKSSELKLGPETDPTTATDPNQVAKYIQDIQDGKPIDPVIVHRDANGQIIVDDGKHRLEALAALGKEDVPVVEKAAGPADANAPVEIKPQSGVSQAAPQGDIPAQTSEAASPQVEAAKQQVIDSLGSAQSSYDAAAATRSVEKGVRAGQATSAFEGAGGGSEGVQAKLKALKGEYTKSSFTIDIPKENMDVLHNAVESNPNLRPFEKTNTQVALMKLNGDIAGGPTPSDIALLRKAFGNDFADAVGQAVDASQSTKDKILGGVGQVVGLPKSIMASYDLSGTLRQGGILASRFPAEAASAFKDELKYFASTDAFKKGMEEIANRPTFDLMMKSKLAVTGTEALDKTEEQFVSNLAEKIPGFGRGVAASDRAYTGFLTKLRADVFDNIVSKYADEGIQLGDKELKDIATFINTASGRGDLGKYLEQHSQTLSTALFSPRLWKSRLDMLNPVYYAKLSGPARKYALQSAATFAGEASIVLGLASLAGAKVETDMRSSDFGKIKVGNTRYDILGGLQQNIVFAWREISGQKKNSETGDITDLTAGKFGSADRLSTLSDMIQNKENPALAAGQRILQGHDRGGNPVNPITELAKLAVPLPFSGAVETAKDTGSIAKGVAMNLPDLFGISAQTYGTTATKDKGKPDATGVPTFKGEVKPNMVTDAQGNVLTDAKGKPITVKFKGNETDLEKQAMLDEKRSSALKDRYVRTLPKEDQQLMKLSDSQLQSYVDSGKIDQARFDHIKNIQKTAESQSKGNVYDVPKGVESDLAKQVYQKYNSMDAKDQKYWLSDKNPPDESAKQITALVNQQRSKGLSEFKPSNALAKLYADYEKSLNTNDNLTEIDKRNKAKEFQVAAAKLNLNANQNDIFAEGGSSDLKTLIDNKQIDKADLDAAIKLDDELYNSGLTGSLKFSKKFRATYGYGLPTGGGINENPNNGSGSSTNAHLDAYLPSASAVKGTSGVPQFSKKVRTTPSLTSGVTPPKAPSAGKVTIKL